MRRPDLAAVPDGELLSALPRNPAALEEFYRRHVRPLTRYIAKRAPVHADDIVAATFLAAIESARGYDKARGEPAAWLYEIANNLLAAHYRRSAADARAVARLASLRPIGPHHEEPSRVEERLDAARRIGPVTAVLGTLPPAERELVELVVADDLTVPEAANRLGIRSGAARMRLARVRARLLGRRR